eukprot:scaffold309_cov136-Isochrysis_galbana.AAC.1
MGGKPTCGVQGATRQSDQFPTPFGSLGRGRQVREPRWRARQARVGRRRWRPQQAASAVAQARAVPRVGRARAPTRATTRMRIAAARSAAAMPGA